MNNWKHYAGSILLAGLLLQGCSDTPTEDTPAATATQSGTTTLEMFNASSQFLGGAEGADKTQAELELTLKLSQLSTDDAEMQAFVQKVMAENNIPTEKEALKEIALAMMVSGSATPSAERGAARGGLLDKIKGGLTDLMDSSLGGKITGAAFDVVLNSEGVTVFMLDLAYKSRTMSQIMIDAIGRNPDLMVKMCPMLQTNQEFGEKFTALAYDMSPITKDGAPDMGEFFFTVVDAPMYGCLTDAMLLSNHDADHGVYGDENYVQHSTTAYMGMLMARHAKTFFIKPGTSSKDVPYGSTDAFSSLMFDTGVNVDYNGTAFSGHGDANELSNEQLFYALFKTPDATGYFIEAMNELDVPTQTMFMDKIFLGAEEGKETDTVQGYLNIISIGSAMYDGIYGEKDETGTRVKAYGLGAYTGAFVDFAALIPTDRYLAYGKGFMDAGFAYAEYNGINVWDTVSNTAQAAWDDYTAPGTTAQPSASRSAGLGTLGSDWFDDSLDIMISAWTQVSLGDVLEALLDGEKSVWSELTDQGNVAFDTIIDGRNDANETVYPTDITNPLFVSNDTVYGFHGLIELAMREDIVNTHVAEGNTSYTMADAEAAFTLPLFADLTWAFAYTAATDGAVAYYNSFVDAGWLADLSDNELIREYFYPSADNVYIPSWLLAIDWLQLPDNFNNANIADTDFNFDAGFMDIYVASTNPDLVASLDLPQAADPLKTITMEKVEMGSDSIIAVDENGQTLEGLYIYKVRVVSAADTAAVLAYLNGLVDSGLTAIGIDSTNAAETVATVE